MFCCFVIAGSSGLENKSETSGSSEFSGTYVPKINQCLAINYTVGSDKFAILTFTNSLWKQESNLIPKFIKGCDSCESYVEISYVFPQNTYLIK